MTNERVVKAVEALLEVARCLPASGALRETVHAALGRFDEAEGEFSSAIDEYVRTVRTVDAETP